MVDFGAVLSANLFIFIPFLLFIIVGGVAWRLSDGQPNAARALVMVGSVAFVEAGYASFYDLGATGALLQAAAIAFGLCLFRQK